MKENLTKEIFEVHISYVKESVNDLKKEVSSLTRKVENVSDIMLRNTVTVEEHHRRSNLLEDNQKHFLEVIDKISNQISDLNNKIIIIETNVKETHTLFDFIKFLYKNKPIIIKFIVFLIILVSTVIIELNTTGLIKGLFIK